MTLEDDLATLRGAAEDLKSPTLHAVVDRIGKEAQVLREERDEAWAMHQELARQDFLGNVEEPEQRPSDWWRLRNWRHRIASGHWPVWGATYGACGWYAAECKRCGKVC